ncbi:MAG: PfkB family carbohydrate kinase [Elusimicrobiota bacterium]
MKNTILVVGSVALDSVETPYGKVVDALGGSATYFSVAASKFASVRLVGVVGTDFPKKYVKLLESHKVDTTGLEIVDGKTFRWAGRYEGDMNSAKTLDTQLNVFQNFNPKIPPVWRSTPYLFLANIMPELQLKVLGLMNQRPKLVICDTMNLWISVKKNVVSKVFAKSDIVIINESEVKQFTGMPNLLKGARKVLKLGPKWLVIKRGEYGVLLIGRTGTYCLPGYPLEHVEDPTGAGDTFAGGFVGYLAKTGKNDAKTLTNAVVYGSVVASYNVQSFSLRKLAELKSSDIKKRYNGFKTLSCFY